MIEDGRFILVWCGCRSTLFRIDDQCAGQMRFENIIEESGINFVLENSDMARRHRVETMVGGVAAFDILTKIAIS